MRTVDAKVAALEKAGHPVVRISMADIYDLGAEFFRWEIATAVAGSIIGINAFNQPDVEASKIATRNLTSEYEKTGSLPAEKPVLEDGGIKLFTDEKNAADLAKAAGGRQVLAGYLKAHLGRIKRWRLFCLAGIHPDECRARRKLCKRSGTRCGTRNMWQLVWASGPGFCIRRDRRTRADRTPACSCRSLATMPLDLPVPEQKYTFGVVKAAQARGDFQVLAERGRRALARASCTM